ncbi:CAMKK/CAMKK-META protein kinase [Aphanomyces invadans]|uniref:cGMP-dependent protein kinase n=1 Tax=Aphanomyces invadans TaxID=157072 RepID=A0A024UTS4_9STRA|nr:CAMKK/CAMKK-META protein kinase [Aphanomyces invadans]ETW09048.1 CAMKK/CAMKK-META protein kinase [Aphanomyces invadans]|eukprot:XP_008862853.1 CAMKK/CAMKK-META protein kinase [Aphanomyces invadans]
MGQQSSKEEKAARRNKRKGNIHARPAAPSLAIPAPAAAAHSIAPPPIATDLPQDSSTLPKLFSMSPAERAHSRPRVGSTSNSLPEPAHDHADVDGIEDVKVSDSDDSDDILSDDTSVVVEDWLLEGEDIKVEMVEDDGVSETSEGESHTTEVSLTAYMQANRPLYDIMIQVHLFANLSQLQQEQVMKALKPITFKDGEIIVKQGDRGERFFMIAKGEAVVTKLIDGKERMITHLYAGHYFGELALIYDDPRTATVRAVGGVELLYLTQKDFQQVGQVHLSLMLQQVPLLAQLSARDQDVVLTKLKPSNFAHGEYIVQQGEEGTRFYMITRGQAAVIETDADTGEDKELTRLYEGHVFGEMSLIYKEPRTASVVAVGPVKCLYLTKEDFDECLLSERFQRVIQHAYIEKATRRAMRNKTHKLLMHNRTTEYVHLNAESFTIAATADPPTVPVRHSAARETSTLRKHRLANGETVVNKYVIKGELGKGSFGTVKLCANEEDGLLYAVKIMHKTFVQRMANREDSLQDALRREVAIMKKLDHRNVVRLVEVIDDPSSQKVYLVQEYVEKGNLAEVAGGAPLAEEVARKYLRDLLCGLQYLHFHKVVHRDIKPENILVTSDDVAKIADFGAARMVMNEAETLTVAKGTPAFMAPEMFNVNAEYTGPSVDVWSLGATLFMLVFGHPPWTAENEIELADKVQRDELTFPDVVVEPHLKNLLTRMLTKDPERRITLPDVINHEWITREGSDPIINVFVDDPSLLNKVSLDESERAIENIPERIDARLQASLIQAHLILQQKKQQGPPVPLNLSLRSHGSMNSIGSNSDRGSISTGTSSPKRTVSAATVVPKPNHHRNHHPNSGKSSSSPGSLRSKGSHDSMFGQETSRVISAWRHHKRVALMDGHNLSERVRDLLLEQKRMAFSVERAHVTEIILPTKQPTAASATATGSTVGDAPTKQELTDEDLTKRQLSRKKDFLMVTSEVFRNEVGDYQARKVLFQAKSQDFSIASRIPLHSVAGSSDDLMGRKGEMHSRKSSRASSAGGGRGNSFGSCSNSPSKLSSCADLFDDVAMVDADDEGGDEDEEDEIVDQVMDDAIDDHTLGLASSRSVAPPRINSSTSQQHRSRSNSSDNDSDSDYSDVNENVDVNDTFDDLLQSPRFHLADEDKDVAPLEDDANCFSGPTVVATGDACLTSVVQVYVSSKIRENLGLGVRAGYAEAKGARPFMEDRSLALARCPFDDAMAFFGVYDGHNGAETSIALQAHLHHRIWTHWNTSASPAAAIESGCRDMDDELLRRDIERIAAQKNERIPAPMSFSGSAAVFAIVVTTENGVVLHVANIGDCRGVLCQDGDAVDLTIDHKANNPAEKARVEAAGGFVHNGRLDGILAVSRAFGDFAHKSGGHLIATPMVASLPVSPVDEFLLLASDGLFDVLSSQQAINFIRRKLREHGDVQLAAQELVFKAQEYVSHDNISAIVVCFNQT